MENFLDKYPSILSLSYDTKGMIEGTVMSAHQCVQNIEYGIVEGDVSNISSIFKPTEGLEETAKGLCLDIIPNMVNLSVGRDIIAYNMDIMPGDDTESLVVEMKLVDRHQYNQEVVEAIGDVATLLVKVYRNGDKQIQAKVKDGDGRDASCQQTFLSGA